MRRIRQPPTLATTEVSTEELFLPKVRRVPFVAIDFETDPTGRTGAHAIGVVRVERGEVVQRLVSGIRWASDPPQARLRHVAVYLMRNAAPSFAALWPRLREIFDGAAFLAAHNAGFDRGVLAQCCAAIGVAPPPLPFVCTLEISRRTWDLPRHNLAAVCEHLGIPLNHHEPLSDAEACARVLLAARPPRAPIQWK